MFEPTHGEGPSVEYPLSRIRFELEKRNEFELICFGKIYVQEMGKEVKSVFSLGHQMLLTRVS